MNQYYLTRFLPGSLLLKRIIFFACFIIPVFFILFLSFISCEKKQKELKIAAHAFIGYEPLYLGLKTGVFDSELIKPLQTRSATQSIRAYRNGLVDAVALTLDEVLLQQSMSQREGSSLKILLVADISYGADAVIARKNIRKFKDLKGKRVGLENTALGGFFLARALAEHDMKVSDVELVSSEIHHQRELFLSGKIDALVTFQPVKQQLLESGSARVVFDSSQIYGEIIDVIAVRETYLEENPEMIKSFIEKWFVAVEILENADENIIEYIARRENLEKKEVGILLDEIVLPDTEQNRNMFKSGTLHETITELSGFMVRKNLIKAPVEAGRLLEGVPVD